MTYERAQELWTLYLETGALSPADERELLAAFENHPDWRQQFLDDKHLDGSVALLARSKSDADAFKQSVTDRLAAETNGRRFISSVRRKIQSENVQPNPSTRRSKVVRSMRLRQSKPGWNIALSIAAIAALVLLGVLFFTLNNRSNDVVEQIPPPSTKQQPLPPVITPPVSPSAERAIGKVVHVESDDGMTIAHNRQRKPLVAGAEIFSGSEITCGANGFATVSFLDGTLIDVQPETTLQNFADSPGVGKRINIRSGSITATVAKQPPGLPLIVSSASAELTVVGTVFDCTVAGDSTTLEVQEGVVRLKRMLDGANVEVHAGQYIATAETGVALALKTREKSANVLITRGGPIETLDFSPDGTLLAMGSYDGAVRVWNYQSGEPAKEWKLHKDRVRAVEFSHDGLMIASASWDKTARILDASTGTERFKMSCNGRIWSAGFSHDDRTLATGDFAKKLRLWDTSTGKERPSFDANISEVLTLSFSNSGNAIAAAGTGGNIRIYDSVSFTEKRYLHGEGVIESITYSPDDQLIAATQGKLIYLWDVAAHKVVRTFNGHTDNVQCVRFSRDGQTLISCGDDKTIRLWDVRTGALQTTLTAHKAKVAALAVSPKGDVFASAGWGQQARIWRFDSLPKN